MGTSALAGQVNLVELKLPPAEFRYVCRSRCVRVRVALTLGKDAAGAAALLIVREGPQGDDEER